MTRLVFFLEEPSAREMLKGLLPKLLPEQIHFQPVVFEGKQDLLRQLGIKLKGWRQPDTRFVVLVDKDSAGCVQLKQKVAEICRQAGKAGSLIRIACHELESWYLGDLSAVEQAIGPTGIARRQNNRKFRDPDALANAAEELSKIAPGYQKVAGSRAIGPRLSTSGNTSVSFNVFVSGIERLCKEIC
jgi:hypothetical protein